MAYPPNHTFSRPVELHEDKLFSIDRRHNALTVNPVANNFVREVNDGPGNWEMLAEQAAAQAVSGAMPNLAVQARGALIRSSLRGDGRGRWR